jgi:flagellar biosynthesis/type III secretory pathway protein FliH
MLTAEYDREMDIAVNRREAREEGRKEGREEGREEERHYFLELLSQGLSVEEIKARLN